jgi:nitroreductase
MTTEPVPSRRRFLRYAAGAASLAVLGGAGAVGFAGGVHPNAAAYGYWRQKEKNGLSDPQYLALCATLAPSPHNTQPWKFGISGDRIEIFADLGRHLGTADVEFRMMQTAIGSALENIDVAAKRLGYHAEVEEIDADRRFARDGYCASVRLHKGHIARDGLFDALFTRQTTRTEYDMSQPIPAALKTALNHRTTDLPGIGLTWFPDGPLVTRLGNILRGSVRGFLSEDRNRDGMKWFRITPEQWETRRDGIAVFNGDAPLLAKRYVEWFVHEKDLLGAQFKQGEIDTLDRLVSTTPTWGLIYADRATPNQRIQAGRLAERVYLEAAARGYAVQPLCYPTEFEPSREGLRELAGLAPAQDPLFLFRIGKSDYVAKSVRRDLKEVLLA